MRGEVVMLVLLASCGRWNFDPRSDSGGDAVVNACGFHQIAAGNGISCAIDRDGSVWCWGKNDDGELQIGGPKVLLDAIQIALPAPAVQVALGRSFGCARLDDGRVWCWGDNNGGQVGANVSDPAPPTEIVLGADRALDLSVGGAHACIRRTSDQAIVCWGENRAFALGNTGAMIQPPTLVAGSAGTKVLAIGHRHNCGIDAQDRPFCWGRGQVKQLGDDTMVDRAAAGFIPSVPTASSIGAGNRLTCPVSPTGVVRCFGSRYHGGASFDDYPATALVNDGVDVALGEYRGCVRRANKTAACWGYVAQDGLVQLSDTAIPMEMTNVTAIDGGFYHYCAIANGEAVCWGDNGRGELGRGTRSSNPAPVASTATLPIDQLAMGGAHACALSAGRVTCWGTNHSGELGTGGSQPASFAPTELVLGVSTIEGISATCAWGNGTASCWGSNEGGRLGDGGSAPGPVLPVTVAVTNVRQVELGAGHGCASTTTTMQCWGANNLGQLGNSTNTPSASPVVVTGVSNVSSFSIDGNSTCALDATNTLFCWGANDRGQLGDGSTTARNAPVTPILPSAPQMVSRGELFTCAIATPNLYCWGANDAGQLGVGDRIARLSPALVTLPGVEKIFTGGTGACAQVTNGDVYCWGAAGQNASGTYEDVLTPQRIPALTGATHVELTSGGGCAVVAGTLTCWGRKIFLGNGDDSETRPLPVTAAACAR